MNDLYLLTTVDNTNITELKGKNFPEQKVAGIGAPVHYIQLQTEQKCLIRFLPKHKTRNQRGERQTLVMTPMVRKSVNAFASVIENNVWIQGTNEHSGIPEAKSQTIKISKLVQQIMNA